MERRRTAGDQQLEEKTTLRLALGALACAASLAVATPSFAQSGEAPLKLDIPFNAVSFDVAPLWTAIEGKLFQRYGIDATTPGAVQSPALVASMLSGETPVGFSGPDAVISADLSGGDIVILAAGPRVDFAVFTVSKLHSVADLKGKKIGVTRFGTSTDFITRYVLKKAGLNPENDATILPMGTQGNMVTALASGVIDGGVLWADDGLAARRLGTLNVIADMRDYDLYFYSGSLIARRSWIAAHHADTLNVVRGYVAGIAAVYRNPKATMAAIGKYTRNADPKVEEQAYQALIKVLPKVPLPEAAVLQTALDSSSLAAAKKADPTRFIDASFVEALQKDGFIDRLYQ